MLYRCYIGSLRWRNNAARLSELKFSRGRCRLCFEQASALRRIEVHHATYLRLGREAAGDLVALCSLCHRDVEAFLRRRRFACHVPIRADVIRLRDRRRPLTDPTR